MPLVPETVYLARGITRGFLFHIHTLLLRCHRHNNLVLLDEARKRQHRGSTTPPPICKEAEVVGGALTRQDEVAGVGAAAEIVDALLCHASHVTRHTSRVTRHTSRTQLPTEPVKEKAAIKVAPVVPAVSTDWP